MDENFATLWESLADVIPEHEAIVVGDRRITWRWSTTVLPASPGLAELGVSGNDKVAQLLYNCPEYLDTTYASFKLRAATVNVNYRYKAPEIVHVLGDAGAKALVFHGAFAKVVDKHAGRYPSWSCWCRSTAATVSPAARSHQLRRAARRVPAHAAHRTGGNRHPVALHRRYHRPAQGRGVDPRRTVRRDGFHRLRVDRRAGAHHRREVGRVAAELSASGRSPVNMTAPPLMHGTGLFLASPPSYSAGAWCCWDGSQVRRRRAAASGAARGGHPAVHGRRRIRQADRGRDWNGPPRLTSPTTCPAWAASCPVAPPCRPTSNAASAGVAGRHDPRPHRRQRRRAVRHLGHRAGPGAAETAKFMATPRPSYSTTRRGSRSRGARGAPACWQSPARDPTATTASPRPRRRCSG